MADGRRVGVGATLHLGLGSLHEQRNVNVMCLGCVFILLHGKSSQTGWFKTTSTKKPKKQEKQQALIISVSESAKPEHGFSTQFLFYSQRQGLI